MKRRSLTRRLMFTVLVLELSMGVALVSIAAVHERQVRMNAFDMMLQGRVHQLLGAVEDADDVHDDIVMDSTGLSLPKSDIYKVQDEKSRLLGESSPRAVLLPQDGWSDQAVGNLPYRFLQVSVPRIIDPRDHQGGTRHVVTVMYGARTDGIWARIFSAIRFYSIVILVVISITAALMIVFLRHELEPLHQLAAEAGNITPQNWSFHAPAEAKRLQELRPLSDAIEAALRRMQQSFEQRRRFTSDAAHELKTEVAIAKSTLQLLALKPREAAEYRRGLATCLEDCQRLEHLVLEMLTFARVDSAGPVVRLGSCVPLHAVQEVMRQTSAFAEMRGVRVELRSTSEEAVTLDSRDAALLVLNLVMNALEHTEAGARVWIELSADEEMVRLTVQDEGEGISAEDLEHIFEPFYRADPSRNRNSGGTGLGLSICEGICTQAGGSIRIESKLHEGTTVIATLPRATLLGEYVVEVGTSVTPDNDVTV